MSHDHIVKSFDEQLQGLIEVIMRMGGLAERQLARAIEAFLRRDPEQARDVVSQDKAIDALEEELEDAAIKVLVLRQPMANDLRTVVSALKISSDLERIGDYAKNIAKRSIVLADTPHGPSLGGIRHMSQIALGIIKDSLDAYAAGDADKALAAWQRDRDIDEIYNSLFREQLTYMMEDPRNISSATHVIFIAKNLERIGDHATNICETIHYLATGDRIEGDRPKGDKTSFTLVQPMESVTSQAGEED